MILLSQAKADVTFLRSKLSDLEKKWDGKSCILEMKNNNFPHWRQMEWIGFYGEYAIRKLLSSQTTIKPTGETFGNVVFDLGGVINWDIKTHPNSAVGAILNDCKATDSSIDKNNYHGLIILCVDCKFDDAKGSFKNWHDSLKGGKSNYEIARIARGAPSRTRKVSAVLTDVKLILLDKSNISQLDKAQKGWRNSDGRARKAKYSITHDQINSLSVQI